MEPAPFDRIVSKLEAVGMTSLSARTLDRLSDLPRVQLSPGRVGYRISDLQRWIADRRTVKAA